MKTVKETAHILESITSPDHPFLKECEMDGRSGVQALVKKWKNAHEKKKRAEESFRHMSMFEDGLKQQGYTRIAGIDEVGRGPLAGPVVAAAVILPAGFFLPGLNDSKQLTKSKREEYAAYILEHAEAAGIGIIHSEEIDRLNIYQAAKKAMLSALADLHTMPDHLLVDAMELETPVPQLSLIKGDARSISIAAASIVAKVERDRMMAEYAVLHPEYGFENHMGYGTAVHLEALDKYGPLPWHRKSFAPVKERL